MKNDLLLDKVNVIERCIRRIYEEYDNNPKHLDNMVKQDTIILNLQRACEASIALAIHVVAKKKLGLPQNNVEAITLLETEGVIPSSLSEKMKDLLCFQRVAEKDDQNINLETVKDILDNHLIDFFHLTKSIISYCLSFK